MACTVTRISGESLEVGEAPHWCADTNSLYYVDAFGHFIHKYTPSTNHHAKAFIGQHISFIIPIEGCTNRFVASLERQLCIITWDGNSTKVSKIEKVTEVDTAPGLEGNQFNDAKVDPLGRLWAGTRGGITADGQVEAEKGTLYSFDKNGHAKSHVSNIHISNGLGWSPDAKKFYYIDSAKCRIDVFDFNLTNGTISNRRVLFTLAKHDIPGFPDGQAVDAQGNVWVAIFDGSRVIKIHGDKPETLLGTYKMPAKQVTSLAFGGQNLDELFVTTARWLARGDVLPPSENGVVYRITGLGVKGLPGVPVKL